MVSLTKAIYITKIIHDFDNSNLHSCISEYAPAKNVGALRKSVILQWCQFGHAAPAK